MRLSRQNVLLLVLLALMGVLAWQRLRPATPEAPAPGAARTTPTAPPRAAARPRPTGAATGTTGTPTASAPTVQLAALTAERETPGDGGRNPFRFERAAPVAPPPTSTPAPARLPPPMAEPPMLTVPTVGASGSGQEPSRAPAAPITLKFIGRVQRGDGVNLAVLSSGEGKGPLYGREGDIIEGRYRIIRIGDESLEIEYADGRGRQTLKLSGQ